MKTNGYRITKDARLPSPDYSPEGVIDIVLNFLQHNDTPCKDAGIEQSLAFSSPDFRPPPGSSEQFFEIVKNSIYSPLLDFQSIERQPLCLTVTASDGGIATCRPAPLPRQTQLHLGGIASIARFVS